MVCAEVDTTMAAGNKAMEVSRVDSKAMSTAVVETTTAAAAVAAVNNKKTRTEKSNLVNLRSIVGHTDVIIVTTNLDANAKMQATICMR